MKNIVIIGAGDLGKEVVWLIEDVNKLTPQYVILGFLDDDKEKEGGEFYGYKVLGGTEMLEALDERNPISAVVAIQDGSVRQKIVAEHPEFNKWESIIHPTAVVASSSPVGRGSILFPQVTVSVDTKLGDFGLLYIHSTVCNDCVIGDYVSIMSGVTVSERAEVGNGCFFATNSCVYPHVRIGSNVKLLAGTGAGKDCPDESELDKKSDQ